MSQTSSDGCRHFSQIEDLQQFSHDSCWFFINRPVLMSVFMFDKRSRLTDYFCKSLNSWFDQ